jgi:hypothetical protein
VFYIRGKEDFGVLPTAQELNQEASRWVCETFLLGGLLVEQSSSCAVPLSSPPLRRLASLSLVKFGFSLLARQGTRSGLIDDNKKNSTTKNTYKVNLDTEPVYRAFGV